MLCAQCGKPVVLAEVVEHYGHLFTQADALGMESLGEDDQAVVEGHFCVECLLEDEPPPDEPDDGICGACGCQDCDCGGPTPHVIPCICCGETFLASELSSVGCCKSCRDAEVEEEVLAEQEKRALPPDLDTEKAAERLRYSC